MIARRFAGMLASLFMLHLFVVSGDLTCATHGDEGASAGAGLHAAHPAQHEQAGEGDGERTDCDVPARPRCCEAFTSCGVFAMTSGTRRSEPPSSVAEIAALSIRAPSLGRAAPEPPPPRV
jgi:hypothetical protein